LIFQFRRGLLSSAQHAPGGGAISCAEMCTFVHFAPRRPAHHSFPTELLPLLDALCPQLDPIYPPIQSEMNHRRAQECPHECPARDDTARSSDLAIRPSASRITHHASRATSLFTERSQPIIECYTHLTAPGAPRLSVSRS
jgi:hypothetical protein